ncbi:hypothetical protein AB0L13_02875 [Saccharopolyspora shandongensis]
MIPHHQGAIQMARIAQQRSTRRCDRWFCVLPFRVSG